MKRLKLGKFIKFFAIWSRQKVILFVAIAVLLIVASTGFYIFRQQIFADIIVPKNLATGSLQIHLPKDLADKIKASSGSLKLETADEARIQQLVDNEISKLNPRQIGAGSALEADKIALQTIDSPLIIFLDEMGQPILPDLEKLNQQTSVATRSAQSGVPEGNQLTFIIRNYWTPEEATKIRQILDEIIPKMREILGPPLFNIQVAIDKSKGNISYAGLYLNDPNTITVNRNFSDVNADYFKSILVHEIGHAWRDDLMVINNRYYEEGLARFTEDIIANNDIPLENSFSKNGLTALFMNNYSRLTYLFGCQTMQKIYATDNAFVKKFHSELYKAGKPGLAGQALLASIPDKVEGKAKTEWLKEQPIHPDAYGNTNGPKIVFISPMSAIFYSIQGGKYFTQFSSRMFEVKYYDTVGNLIYKTNLEGKPIDSWESSMSGKSGFIQVLFFQSDDEYREKVSKEYNVVRVEISDMGTGAKASIVRYAHYGLPVKVIFSDMSNFGDDQGNFAILKGDREIYADSVCKNGTDCENGLIEQHPENPNSLDSVLDQNSLKPLKFTYECSGRSHEKIVLTEKIVSSRDDLIILPNLGYDITKKCREIRDAIRKKDIDGMQDALEKYRQANGIYPESYPGSAVPNNGWVSSKDWYDWVSILQDKIAPYMPDGLHSYPPSDPSGDTFGDKWVIDGERQYYYYSHNYGKSDKCQWYMLVYRLESEPKASSPGVVACDGTIFQYNNAKIDLGIMTVGNKVSATRDPVDHDAQRRIDLIKLKTSIDTYSKTKGLPASDGWIATKDIAKANDSLAETLLPAKLIDKIPCDPANTAENCKSGITYQYWRSDYFKGSPREYGLYAKLDNPTAEDKTTMNTGNAKMNTKAKEYGMNYRVGN